MCVLMWRQDVVADGLQECGLNLVMSHKELYYLCFHNARAGSCDQVAQPCEVSFDCCCAMPCLWCRIVRFKISTLYAPASGVLLGKVVVTEYLLHCLEVVVKVTEAVDVVRLMVPLPVSVSAQPHDWQAVEDRVVAQNIYRWVSV